MRVSKSFGRGAAALAVIGIISKLAGALYRIPLTNILGAEGMGLYQTVFPVFTVLLMVCGGGMTGAVSRTVAKYSARGDNAAVKDILIASAIPVVCFSAVAAAAVIIYRRWIAGIQGVPAASGAYLALCPSLVFCSIISALRGLFQGRNMMLPSGISQLIEQGVKLGLGLLLGRWFMPRGAEYAVFGALLGVTASEAAAFAYLVIRYIVYGKRVFSADDGEKKISRAELFKEVMRFSLPVTVGMLMIPLTQVFDSAVVVNMLVAAGTERSDATALFGLYVGPVGTLINMPAVVLSSLSAAFLPVLTAFTERGDAESARTESAEALKWTFVISLPVAAAFLFFPREICTALYGTGLTSHEVWIAARLLRIEAISVFYLGVISYATATLHAHGKAYVPTLGLAAGAAVKTALAFLLIPRLGIEGAAVGNCACYGAAAVLDVVCIKKYSLGINAEICVRPLIFSALSCAVFFVIDTALGGGTVSVFVSGAAFLLVYLCIFPSMRESAASIPLFERSARRQKRVKK